MCAKSRDFRDESEDQFDAMDMSDAEVEALMSGHSAPTEERTTPIDSLEPGSRISGVVVDFRAGEVLVELDQKTHGIIDESEFEDEELPRVGQKIQVLFQRFDTKRELAVLATREVRREILWDELRPGMIVEGIAIEANRGGLVVDIKGVRAFLPVSQIERARVEDPAVYVGTKMRCEVTSVDRARSDLVVSRRVILDREAEVVKGKALSRLGEGEILKGTVVKVTGHGAFVDLGGVEGLLHASKIAEHHQELGTEKTLRPGQQVQVVITRVDRDRGRISLDFHQLAEDTWRQTVERYEVGDEATGWVTQVTPEGAVISVDDGVEGLIPRNHLLSLAEIPSRGSILRVVVTRIDLEKQELELKPSGDGA